MIDLVAPTVQVLLKEIDGKTVTVHEQERTLHTADAAIVEIEMGWKHRILNILSDPNIAYIFFLLGVYGLLFELYNPGSVLPGVVGAISLILAFYSMHTLPVNYAGLALIIVGIILFVLELKITSYGLLTVGGAISLLLGSIMLINSDSALEFVAISWSVIIPSVVVTVLFFVFAIGMGIRAQLRTPVTGTEGLVGETGNALQTLAPTGQVRVHGEIWNATTSGSTVPAGSAIEVVRVEKLLLIVRPHSQ